MSSPVTHAQSIAFAEFVRPTLWSLVPCSLLGVGVTLVSLPILETPLSLVFGALTALATVAAVFGSGYWVKVIRSADVAILQVGAARILVDQLSAPRLAQGAEMMAERGPKLNARAYRKFQSGVPTVVIVDVADDQDPTPYWIFNLRKAGELVALLESNPTVRGSN
jgi:hypothetical protein